MNKTHIKSVTIAETDYKEVKTAAKIKGDDKRHMQCSLKVGDRWYYGCMFAKNIQRFQALKDGDQETFSFYQEKYEGKTYSKFRFPSDKDLESMRLSILEAKVDTIIKHLNLNI